MSAPPPLRRTDKAMDAPRALALLEAGFCGRLATIGADGYPYCVPLLYVVLDGTLYVHGTSAEGHLRRNVAHDARVCFEIDEPGEVYPYGRFECDSTIAFRSVILFGRIAVVDDLAAKERFFAALMRKYARADWERPKNFFPRIGEIALYAITIERITGKETPLPGPAERWPARDQTKSPNAKPPP
jgi:uncharacterized protein